MKKFFTLLFILPALFLQAQKQANVWYFGTNAGVNFNSGSPVAITGALSTNEGCATISDKNSGQVLFYTDGITVYNRNNVTMSNGTGLLGDNSCTQSGVIIPKPGSSTLYYIFTADAQDGLASLHMGEFCYNTVDMNLGGGLGAVTVKNQVLMQHMTEKIAAYRHCNGRDIWVVSHQWNSNAFYSYLVSSAGVAVPVISYEGTVHQNVSGTTSNVEAIGYMKISPDGSMIGVACDYNLHLVEVFPFNNSTGTVGAPIFTDSATWTVNPASGGPYGLSFSPDNKLLYVTVEGEGKLYQYNLKAGNAASIITSKQLVGQRITSGQLGAVQIEPDGKMYVAQTQTAALGVINNPNTLGAGCNFVESAFPLLGNSDFGLPDFVETFLAPIYSATFTYSDCQGNTNTLSFTDTTLNGTTSPLWNFGDPGSGTADTSTAQNPSHTFSSGGIYTVTVYLSNQCKTDTLTKTVTITQSTQATAVPADTAFCDGDSVQLQASGGTTYKWSPTTGLNNPNIANPVASPSVTTTYTVTVSPPPCGDSTATVHITVYPSPPPPNITKSNDTLYCTIDTSYKSYQWYYNDTLIIGATNTFFKIVANGNYNVAVTNSYGCMISAGIILHVPVIEDKPFLLYPNPVTDKLTIYDLQFTIKEVDIYNSLGALIYKSTPARAGANRIYPDHFGKSQIELDLSALSPGVYFIECTMDDSKRIDRFVKE